MSRRLIVADESIIIHKTFELILSSKDFVINTFIDGESALMDIRDKAPDIVFADVDLTEINGYDLCSAVKKEPSLRTVQVILLVSAIKGIDEQRVKESGADDYIIKPFEPEDLLDRIETARTSKDTIEQLRNEAQKLREKLKKSEKKAEKTKKELLSKMDSAKTSEGTVSQLKKELQQVEKNTIKIKKKLIEKILQRSITEITDRIIEEIIHGSLMAELKSTIEKALEEKVPYIVEGVITRGIEEIKLDDEQNPE